jgi:hypothetical protein
MRIRPLLLSLCLACGVAAPELARGQAPPQPPQDPHAGHDMSDSSVSPWMLMSDGVVFGTFNHQDGERGVDEFRSSNWWMGMASRPVGNGTLTLTGMLSLEPATVGACGYGLLFQVGESCNDTLIVDRQHPHDFLMHASASWRLPLNGSTSLTLSGAPVGDPALGPIAFMHRPSAAENATAPLAHHWLDATHIAMGVISAGLQLGPLTLESSLFHGGEPDSNRWDLMDPGALDSWSARVWFEPSPQWSAQVSYGFLKKPEEFEEGDVRRTTASLGWWRKRGSGFTAATIAFGLNDKSHDDYAAFLAEATHRQGAYTGYGRLEKLQVELEPLLSVQHGGEIHHPEAFEGNPNVLMSLTLGGTRELALWRGFEIAAGADGTLSFPPEVLNFTYGEHPISFHVFFRIRPPVGHMGRMWNMRMGGPH